MNASATSTALGPRSVPYQHTDTSDLDRYQWQRNRRVGGARDGPQSKTLHRRFGAFLWWFRTRLPNIAGEDHGIDVPRDVKELVGDRLEPLPSLTIRAVFHDVDQVAFSGFDVQPCVVIDRSIISKSQSSFDSAISIYLVCRRSRLTANVKVSGDCPGSIAHGRPGLVVLAVKRDDVRTLTPELPGH